MLLRSTTEHENVIVLEPTSAETDRFVLGAASPQRSLIGASSGTTECCSSLEEARVGDSSSKGRLSAGVGIT